MQAKGLKRRLKLYLRSIQIEPGLNFLTQYDELAPEQRKLARLTGRRLIREAGSIAKAVAALKIPAIHDGEVSGTPSVAALTRAQFREKRFDQISQKWSPLTPACPSCRMGHGLFPKRSWPTREWAEEVWARQPDRHLMRVYACPVQPGFWHLGHISRASAPMLRKEGSIPLSHLAGIPAETGEHA